MQATRRDPRPFYAATVALLGVLTMLLIPAAGAFADEAAAPGDAGLAISPAAVSPGGTVTVTGSCRQEGLIATEVNVVLANEIDPVNPLTFETRLPVDAAGDVAATFNIPSTVIPGNYTLATSCVLQDQLFGPQTFDFTVLGDAATSAPPAPTPGAAGPTTGPASDAVLPETGNGVLGPAALAAILVVLVGALATVFGRSRKQG